MRYFIISIFFLLHICQANTNLGVLNTIRNGFAEVKSCREISNSNQEEEICHPDLPDDIKEILNLVSKNQCLASKLEYQNINIDIPDCPSSTDQIKGVDNTYPSSGIFVFYNGENDNFIHDLASSYLSDDNNAGRFNLILPSSKVALLRNNQQLVEVLNSKRVNVLNINTNFGTAAWMQDSFQFVTINGQPAIYQVENLMETESIIERRLACKLAEECDLPYYIVPDMIRSHNAEYNSLNSGGNLEVFPGGTFYTGIIKTDGFGFNDFDLAEIDRHREERASQGTFQKIIEKIRGPKRMQEVEIPFRTRFQEKQKTSLERSGNKVLELDVSFLKIGHVDEIVNVVKTNQPKPCDYAVLVARPSLAFDLMEEAASMIKNTKTTSFRSQNRNVACEKHSYQQLNDKGKDSIISTNDIRQVYDSYCLNGDPIEEYVLTDEFKILRDQNLGHGPRQQVQKSCMKICN